MTRLLLDHPWPLDAALNARSESEGRGVLLKFDKLIRHSAAQGVACLSPVRFIEQQEYDDMLQRLKGNSSAASNVRRFAYYLIRRNNGINHAAPLPEPNPPLSDCWKQALRDELEHLENWRNPQIIFPEVRRSVWPATDEIEIKCEDQEETASRVLASLEEYESHPYAMSDLDPWDVRCTAPNGEHPCYLPNPLMPDSDPLQNLFQRVPIAQLYEKLAEVHRRGWQVGDKHFFIPPADWQPEAVTQAAWREGRAFPRKLSPERQQMGYCDFAGRVWVWHKGRGNHKGEDHWDVQLGGIDYISVNHNGDPP